MQSILIILSVFIFTSWKSCSSAVLPKWVYRVDSCPDPKDIDQWINASKALNCHHDLMSTDPNKQASVYHCMPSIHLNETVEFCGRSVPIAPGFCPIYNYGSTFATYHSCLDFTYGCPTAMFHSKKVYQHPECLKINRISRCFEAQTNCSQSTATITSKTTTENRQRRLTSTTSVYTYVDGDTKHEDSVDVVKMSAVTNSNNIYILITVSSLAVTILLIVGLTFLLRKRIYIQYKHLFPRKPRTIPMAELNELNGTQKTHTNESVKQSEIHIVMPKENDGNPTSIVNGSVQHRSQEKASDESPTTLANGSVQHHSQDKATGHGCNHDDGERFPLLEKMINGTKMGQYNNLLRTLSRIMTEKVFKRIKCFVKDREEVNSEDLKEIKEPKDLLDFLDGKYFVYNNLIYLQGLFLACKAPELYDECVKYAKNRGEEIHFFEKGVLENGHTKVKYIINCPGVSKYPRSELEKLREMLANLIHANYDDILVSGVKTGCVIVTMMIRNCLIPKLRALYTSEKLTLTCHWMLKLSLKHKIMKVMIQDEVIYPPDTLQSVDELTAEASLSCRVLRSALHSETKLPKTNDLDRHISNAIECREQSANCEDNVLSKVSDMVLTKTIPSESNDFTKFLERIGGRITDDTWHSMKTHLCEFVDHKRVEKMNPTKMLNELSDMLKLQYNMSFLEWIFDKCGKPKLVKDCQQYSAENQFQLECFNTNFPQSVESQPIEIQFMVFELESYRDELQDLRYWLAKTIDVHPGQILMTALQNGPIVVTFIMRKNHGNAILEYLKTDDGQIALSHKRIEKIVQNGNVIEIGKALNGSTFVHIRLRLRENRSGIRESVRNLASIFTRRTGIPMEGTEVYTRTVPADQKRNETKAKLIKEESFTEKNRGLILENIEPLTIEHTDIAYLFNRKDLAGMKDITGRRDRAEYFLKLCDKLPKENREIACAYLEGIVSLPKEKSTYNEELSPLKKRIQQIREDVLDEIDSEFIKSTIYQLEDVPEDVKISWSDPNKSRKEKAKIFLDFALQKDEYVKALKKTMEEYGMQFTE
ncbi:uncharacterized protein [Magallana gigas]|uniref:uncharacterized protein isoform X5 n=1 Tax=Magallana gigas TaxID=29159 RepID=UPI003340DDD2